LCDDYDYETAKEAAEGEIYRTAAYASKVRARTLEQSFARGAEEAQRSTA
jgi:hypothetical protein